MKKLGQKSVDKLAQDDTVVNSKAGIQIRQNYFRYDSLDHCLTLPPFLCYCSISIKSLQVKIIELREVKRLA